MHMWVPNFKILKVFHLTRVYVGQQLNDIRLSSGLFYFIIALDQVDSLNMSELASAVGVDNAYITRSVEKLSTLGYVQKIQNEQDRRVFRVSLTPTGKKIANRVNRVMQQWVELVTVDVSMEDIATVNRVFDQLYQNALQGLEKRRRS